MIGRRLLYLLLSVMSIVVLLWASYRAGYEAAAFPKPDELVCTETRGRRVALEEYGASIRVDGLVRPFFYSRKSGEFESMTRLLEDGAPLTLCRRRSSLPADETREVSQVVEIRRGSRTVRGLAEIRAAWRDDARLLFILCPLVLLGSTYLAYQAGSLQRKT